MKFCRHDWYVHKEQFKNTLRHSLLIGDKNPPALTFILALVFPGIMLLALSHLPWFADILLGSIGGLLLFLGSCWFLDTFYPGNPDPWKAKDTSCLKCSKIKFNYTKWYRKHLKNQEAKRVRDNERYGKEQAVAIIKKNNIKNADIRYEKMLKLY